MQIVNPPQHYACICSMLTPPPPQKTKIPKNTHNMQVLETAIADDKGRRIAGQVGLDVMKQLIAAKSHQRVLAVYRLLRVRGYIGRGNQNRARVTTMATCYGARAAEVGWVGEIRVVGLWKMGQGVWFYAHHGAI